LEMQNLCKRDKIRDSKLHRRCRTFVEKRE
jgi:hypothetical protein